MLVLRVKLIDPLTYNAAPFAPRVGPIQNSIICQPEATPEVFCISLLEASRILMFKFGPPSGLTVIWIGSSPLTNTPDGNPKVGLVTAVTEKFEERFIELACPKFTYWLFAPLNNAAPSIIPVAAVALVVPFKKPLLP